MAQNQNKFPIVLVILFALFGMTAIGYAGIYYINKMNFSPENMHRMKEMIELVKQLEEAKRTSENTNPKIVRDTIVIIPPNGAIRPPERYQYTDGPHLYNDNR